MFDGLHNLALLIAPELAAAPFYVLAPPPGYPQLPHIRAFTHKDVDYKIRKALIKRGEWQGPGATIVLNMDLLSDRESIVGALIHETSHNTPATAPPEDHEPTDEEFANQVEVIGLWAAMPADAAVAAPLWHPFHDWKFIRRCLHLRHRAAKFGYDIPYPAIQASGWMYGTSGTWRYARALGDEPQRMIDATFEEIENASPPAAFVELWESDTSAWHTNRK
jgi:hypothetical protein